MTDYATRWVEAVAMSDQTATTIAKAFLEEVVLRHGCPLMVLSDQGSNFLSKTMSEIVILCGATKLNTSPYHPQTDGLVERFNKTLPTILSMYVQKNQRDWDEYLPYALFSYRTSIHESARDSPFFLLYGRDARLPIDAVLTYRPSKYCTYEEEDRPSS